MELEKINEKKFYITDNAAKKIALLEKLEQNQTQFRITVSGGGCSGFKYDFSFDNKKNNDDQEFGKNGVGILIDDISLGFIAGSTLDYIEDLTGSSFVIKNPQATATCGCGNSFNV